MPNLDLILPLLDWIADRIAGRIANLQPPVPTPRLLTVDQAAVYLGRTKDAIQHMIAEGKLPTVRSDRRVFLDLHDLDRWIESNKTFDAQYKRAA
jgi:excisionase family DNA binding protein